jgi:hypothetical protein
MRGLPPPYQFGMPLGVLIGLRLALDAITREMSRQEDAAIVAALDDPHTAHPQPATSAGRLLVVEGIVSAPFRVRP